MISLLGIRAHAVGKLSSFGNSCPRRGEAFQPWDFVPTAWGSFPALGFRARAVGKLSSFGNPCLRCGEAFQLWESVPTPWGSFPALGFSRGVETMCTSSLLLLRCVVNQHRRIVRAALLLVMVGAGIVVALVPCLDGGVHILGSGFPSDTVFYLRGSVGIPHANAIRILSAPVAGGDRTVVTSCHAAGVPASGNLARGIAGGNTGISIGVSHYATAPAICNAYVSRRRTGYENGFFILCFCPSYYTADTFFAFYCG